MLLHESAAQPTQLSLSNAEPSDTVCVWVLAGKLEAAHKTPADLQLQLQQAQQQNQTLARILAERCEQAAAHVEHQQQLQDMWQQLLAMQAVPASGTVQVRHLAAFRFSFCLVALPSGLPFRPCPSKLDPSFSAVRFCLRFLP